MTYPHPAGPTPSDNPQPHTPSRSLRFAISAGPLTAALLATREAEAGRTGKHLLEVCNEAELLHLQLIQRVMSPGATWEDAVAAIRAAGRA